MAVNQGADFRRTWRKGDPLLAEDLSRVAQAIIARILGGTGVRVRPAGKSVIIEIDPERGVPRIGGSGTNTGWTLAILTNEIGGGVYNWSPFKGIPGYPLGGSGSGSSGSGSGGNICVEMNGSTGILCGDSYPSTTAVVLFKQGGIYWFQLPIGVC